MKGCCVLYCIPSDRSDDVTYHRIPTQNREEWWKLAGRKDQVPKEPRICSDHFTPDCFSIGANLSRHLKKNVMPSLKLELPVSQYKELLTTIQDISVEVEHPPPVSTPPPTEPHQPHVSRASAPHFIISYFSGHLLPPHPRF